MRRIPGFALLFIFSSLTLMAAKNTQTFYLNSDVRAGNVQLTRGICEVTWSPTSGSRVELTIKTDDKKTVTVPAVMVEGKEDKAGMVTTVVNGVTYLVELHTRSARFIFENATASSK
jgi:hypothetical protein